MLLSDLTDDDIGSTVKFRGLVSGAEWLGVYGGSPWNDVAEVETCEVGGVGFVASAYEIMED